MDITNSTSIFKLSFVFHSMSFLRHSLFTILFQKNLNLNININFGRQVAEFYVKVSSFSKIVVGEDLEEMINTVLSVLCIYLYYGGRKA